MAAPALTAPPKPLTECAPESNGHALPLSGKPKVEPSIPGRFAWERQLRSAKLSRTIKGFLLYLGTFMDGTGRNCRPSSKTIMDDWSISRERAFELFSEAERTGWIVTRQRPGKPSERVPVIPTRQIPPDGSESDTRQARPDGSEPTAPAHPSGGTRRVTRGDAGGTRQARPDYTRQAAPDATGTEQEQTGGTLPPDPLRPEHPPGTRNDLPTAPDLVVHSNDTKQVTNRPRVRAQLPLLAVIQPEPETGHTDEFEIPDEIPARIRDEVLPALAAQLNRINSTGAAS